MSKGRRVEELEGFEEAFNNRSNRCDDRLLEERVRLLEERVRLLEEILVEEMSNRRCRCCRCCRCCRFI
ncbi:hypothetical protein [Clostridium sp. CF012]|uniref:hypothetical protein n=1 Tax=Clostridium sp. CF012 TaxID=2843319 RepID=UPI001C0B77B0|nr:hypothetical protein [Clostridium sp. CF012]MBU3145607.1 hypothetical protein [Clostridium sp. CF012]